MKNNLTDFIAYFSAFILIGGWFLVAKPWLTNKPSVPAPAPTEIPATSTPFPTAPPSPSPSPVPVTIDIVTPTPFATRPSINVRGGGEFEDF